MPREPRTPAPGRIPRRLRRRREPAQERARERVERILDATSQLLARGGLEKLSSAKIARRARIPVGSIYQYFESKEAILAELAERKIREIDAASAERLARDSERLPWRRAIEKAVDTSVAAFRDDPAYVIVWRTIRGSPDFRALAKASDERFARALEALPMVAALPAARRRVLVPGGIRIANAFLEAVLEAGSPREAAAVVRELKRALVGYLAEDLDRAETKASRGGRRRGG